jgi:flagellar hook-length control protein FliK
MNKGDTNVIPPQMNSLSRKDLKGVLFSLEQNGREWFMDKEESYPKPVQLNSFPPKDLQIVSSLEANDDNQINAASHEDQTMIPHEDWNNGAHILSSKPHLKSFNDTGSSPPPETCTKDELLIQSKVNDTQNCLVLKNAEPRINTVPYSSNGDGKNNAGLRDNLRMISPESSSPFLSEEIQSPTTIASPKLPVLSETSALIEHPLKSEGSRDKGQSKNTPLDIIITHTEDISSSIDNKNSNETSPLRINILQESPNADIFILQKKGDASIEVSLEPEGMGKIDIELTLDRGFINAQINASEIIGKEIIERNLYAILSSLIDEGLNIGSFSVSLRNRQGDMNDDNRKELLETPPTTKTVQIPPALAQNRIISIFI